MKYAVAVIALTLTGGLLGASPIPCRNQSDNMLDMLQQPYGPEYLQRMLLQQIKPDETLWTLIQEVPQYEYKTSAQRAAAISFLIEAIQLIPCETLYKEHKKIRNVSAFYQALGYTREEAQKIVTLFKLNAAL